MLALGRSIDTSAQDEGVFLVPDDSLATSGALADDIRALTAEEQEAAQIPQVTLSEILYTASVLVKHRNCPVDVVNSILAFSAHFLTFQQEISELHHGRNNMNDEYVRLDLPKADELALPSGVAVSKCVFLVADCVSKDQGWASFEHELNGTYNGSYTWSEVAVKKPVAHTTVEGPDNAENDTAAVAVKEEVARVCVCSNLRAHRRFRHHRKCFQDPSGVIQHIELGDSVTLILRSLYPGWSNTAKYGKLTACFALEFDEDFSSAAIPFPADAAQRSASGAGGSKPACAIQ
uniref:Uncharacterized protein n=1 Tax=Globisporangium ultimum (strain ATCC 200006 / CBS 805.95 / DAOM BR144) TaxID=431595 RepID=K3WQG8_GLOUD